MKRLLIGASTVALAFGAIAAVSPSAIAHEGGQVAATHSDLASNRDAVQFLRYVAAIPINDVNPLMGSYTPEDQAIIAAFVRDTILQGTQDKAEKAKRIHRWLATQVRYARTDETPAVTPREVLDQRLARGQGFSNLYKAMLDSVGIPNVLVTGVSTDGDHQWNIVSANGELFHSDPALGEAYFKKSLEDFSSDHATLRLHGVTTDDGSFRYEYDHGVSLVAINDSERAKASDIPAAAHGMPVVRLSNSVLAAEGLSTLTIPTSISAIDVQAGTGKVSCFNVAAGHPYFAGESCALFSADKTRLIAYPSQATASSFPLPAQTHAIETTSTFDAPALESIEVSPENAHFSSYAGALYTKDYTSLRAVPGGLKKAVVHGKTILEQGAFSHRNRLESIVIENGVTAIPARTFTALPALRSVEFPASLSAIDADAFAEISPAAVTLVGQKGSVVEHFARMKSFPFREHGGQGQAPPTPTPSPAPQDGGQPPVAPQPPVQPEEPVQPDTPVQPPAPVQPAPPVQPEPPVQPGTPTPPSPTPPSPPATPPAGEPIVPPADGNPDGGHSGGTAPSEGSGIQPPSTEGAAPGSSQADGTATPDQAATEGIGHQSANNEQTEKDGEKEKKDEASVKAGAAADKLDADKSINAAGIEKIGLTTDVTLSPGATMTIVASGYESNEVVTFVINAGSKTMGLVRADSLGIAKVTWMIPADFTPGDHTVIAIGTTGKTLKMPVTVAPYPDLKKSPVSAVKPRPSEPRSVDLLAQTGAHVAKAFAIGTLLIGAGATVLALRRRMDEPIR